MDLLNRIRTKVETSERLTDQDALDLFACEDLLGIGELAALANRLKNGDRVYFNVNRHINYTNICVNRCTFCAFSKEPGQEGGYTYALDEIYAKAAEAAAVGATEIHMVGGLHPELPFDFYLEMLSGIRQRHPQLHIKAFTAVEIDYFSSISALDDEQVILALREAGLGSMPGGGAEILGASVRQKICPEKITGERWLEIVEKVHRLGLKTNATMLFGHLEQDGDRVDHLRARGAGGVDALKTLAISRLYLDNFRHIKAYWVMLGLKVAQVSLCFGVNDLDGTVVEEKIGHDAGADSPQTLSMENLIGMIREAGCTPVERDTLYRQRRVC